MQNPLTWLSRRRFPYEPLITVEISRSRLLHNLDQFRKVAPGGMVAPVLKSNAYGHGFEEVASILRDDRRIPFFVVDSYFEALALRSVGVRAQILVIGYTRPEIIKSSRLRDTVFTVTSIETLQSLKSVAHRLPVHLKIDTGMHRQGILSSEIEQAADLLSENPGIVLKGVCSHLCDADSSDPAFTRSQIKIWNDVARRFKSSFSTIEYFHLSATDGHRYTGEIEANVSRLGLGLYGLVDGGDFRPALDLKPVMSMKSIITSVKKIGPDETVGYGNAFKADREMVIATIPAGYYEGVDRRLSNVGAVSIGHEEAYCPIIGRISMNIMTIDVSRLSGVAVGTPVVIVSDEPGRENSILNMAKKSGALAYELAVHVPESLRRVVVA